MTGATPYFKKHCDEAISALTETDVEELKRAETDEDRIRYAYLHAAKVPIRTLKNEKSYDVALKRKCDGNNVYKQKRFGEAFSMYNDGINRCPQDTPEGRELLTILIANRTAVLYETNKFKKVCDDVQYIKKLGSYPQNNLPKLLMREAKSFFNLHRHEESMAAYVAAADALHNTKASPDVLQQKYREIEEAMEEVKFNKLNRELIPSHVNKDDPFTPNKLYPAASSGVDFDEDSSQGRFARAVRDIEPGELVIRDVSHCLVVSYENIMSNCSYCGISTLNPYPCKVCCYAMFCSEQCLVNAGYHNTECDIMSTVYWSGASINCAMALRIVTQKDFDFFWQKRGNLKNLVSPKLPYIYCDYNRVYNLCTHDKIRPRGEFVQYSFMAIFLLRLLKMTKYFPHETQDNILTDKECFIGELLLRHLQILQFNAHEFFELRNCMRTKDYDANYKSAHVGGALYPTLALFNHSCDHNIIRYSKGRRVFVRAIKHITKGDIIYENYGPAYSCLERDARRLQLRERYWFDCCCVPCQENWPLFEHMQQKVLRISCKKCRAVNIIDKNFIKPTFECSRCRYGNGIMNVLLELRKLSDIASDAHSKLDRFEFKAAMPVFCRGIKIYSTQLVAPYQDLVTMQQCLRICIVHDGNTEEGYDPKYGI